MSKTVTITGAAGQIGYQLAFRIASGQLLGANQKINLNLLEITPALDALKGVAMELEDCAFDTLDKISISDDPNEAFKDSDTHFWLELNREDQAWSEATCFKKMQRFSLLKARQSMTMHLEILRS